jgi:hypothetical protein
LIEVGMAHEGVFGAIGPALESGCRRYFSGAPAKVGAVNRAQAHARDDRNGAGGRAKPEPAPGLQSHGLIKAPDAPGHTESTR